MTLKAFLDDKPLYYKEIDYQRIHIAYRTLKPYINRPITVHVVGTNGKGSTGRIIAHLAHRGGLSVGHFSSPHILKFNERIWMDGSDTSDEVLEEAHQRLFSILDKQMSDTLSYFEYTTLLAFLVFESCDMVVLEAGLGGEHDATNVCDKELSVITPIGIDHQAFLGDSIEEIAGTKIRSIQKQALLAPQVHKEVEDIAKHIASDVGATLIVAKSIEDNHENLKKIAKTKGWPEYLLQNSAVAMQALDILAVPYDIEELKSIELFGRFYPLEDNIRIDVGHNPLAARVIVSAMKPETVLIYNSLEDKEYEEVLRILKPKVKRVEIIVIESQRATVLNKIEKALDRVKLVYKYYENRIDPKENYLVFGSFYVVEAFLHSRRIG